LNFYKLCLILPTCGGVEYAHEFEKWWETLSSEQQEAIDDRVMLLAEHGPALKRPVVGEIKSSRHANMKELRAS
jgi:hypothetical protein